MTIPDPTDARADGQFGGTIHRAGSGDVGQIIERARKGYTLAAGEGRKLVALLDAVTAERDELRARLDAETTT